MRPTAVESGFEAAFWFLERALNDGEALQPQKLQRLLFLAQAYFGVAHAGAKLMPGIFVAAEDGHEQRRQTRGRQNLDAQTRAVGGGCDFRSRQVIISSPAGQVRGRRQGKRLLPHKKLFGQMMLRHMCATGEPSKPNPSFGWRKLRPMMSVNVSS